MRLRALNLFRAIRESFVPWGLLTAIYSITLALLIQPILERLFKTQIPLRTVWFFNFAILLFPALLEVTPLGALPLRNGLFGEKLWKKFGGPLAPVYIQHELRRGSTWLTLFVTTLLGTSIGGGKAAIFALVAQLPIQRALYSIHAWRRMVTLHQPLEGAISLLQAFRLSQLIQALVLWLAVGVTGVFSTNDWWMIGPALAGGAMAASLVILEGDSGRPWIVNFVSLACGILGTAITLAYPWFALVMIPLGWKTEQTLAQRLGSVEYLDEDTVIR